MTEEVLEQDLDAGGQLDDPGGEVSDVDVEDIEIPDDMQAAGVTEPGQYLALQKAGITDAKTLKIAREVRESALAEARDHYEKQIRQQPKPDPEPEKPKVEANVDYMEPLRQELRKTLGSEFRDLERAVKAGKLP
ncbi:MAG: hypothetical protein ABIH23_09430, partial [bacterium]